MGHSFDIIMQDRWYYVGLSQVMGLHEGGGGEMRGTVCV